MTTSQWQIAGGTVPGAEHIGRNDLLKGRNNNDAYSWFRPSAELLIAAVCDGCGGSPRKDERSLWGFKHSEVGAKLGAQLVTAALARRHTELSALSIGPGGQLPWAELGRILEAVRVEVLEVLKNLAASMAITAPGESNPAAEADAVRGFTQTVNDFLLFTVVGAVITKELCAVFAIGDGVYAVNGKVVSLGPFPGNIPPYLPYDLVNAVEFPPGCELLQFKVCELMPIDQLQHMLLGTDGVEDLIAAQWQLIPGQDDVVGPLSQFWTVDSNLTNRFGITRRLSLFNSEVVTLESECGRPILRRAHRLLRDDTTLVVIRRK